MTLVTNSLSTYGVQGNREDLTDVIYNISPKDTPFVSMIGKSKAKAVLHEWQTDTLESASSTNAQLEGDTVTAAARSSTSRVQNYCQISYKAFSITGTQEIVDKAGRDSEMAYQEAKAGYELRRDVEAVVVQNQGYLAGATTTARKTRSLESWLVTNTDRGSASSSTGSTGASSTAAGNGATDASLQRQLTEAMAKRVIQQVYSSGGDPTTIMVGPVNKQNISVVFTGRTSARQNIGAEMIQGAASMYASDFGDLKVVPNRRQRERSLFVLSPEYAAIAYLRPFKTEELAKTGDAQNKFIRVEYCLEMRNEAAHGVVADLTTSTT